MRSLARFPVEKGDRCDDPGPSRRSEAGDTLVEVLIALVVIGVAALSLLVAFSTSIWGSSDYRTVATVDTVLRSAAEEATTQLQQQSSTLWGDCGGASSVQFSLPTGYTAQIAATYWNGSAFVSPPPCIPNAAQQDTISVTYKGTVYQIVIVVDDPLAPSFTVGTTSTQLAFVQQPASSGIAAGSNLSPWPMVAVEDGSGNVDQDDLSSVSLAITPGTGTCVGIENLGVFTFSSCSITKSGTYTLTATDGSLTPATSSAFSVGPSTPTQLVYTTSPPSAIGAGSTFSVVVAEEDAYGNIETADSQTAVALSANNGGGAFACATTPTNLTNGVATFTGCSYTVASTSAYTLTASSSSAPLLLKPTAATTVSPAAASKLVITTQPASSITAGGTVSLGVTIEDQYGNQITTGNPGSTDSIGVTLSSGSFAGGTTTVAAVNGVANFTGLQITSVAGSPYTITARDTSETVAAATTNSISVVPAAANKLAITTQPASSITVGGTVSLGVTIEDQYGNQITTGNPGSTDNIGVTLSSGSFAGGTTTVAAVNGVANFTGLQINKAGRYTITATDTTEPLNVTSATTNSITVNRGPASQLVYLTGVQSFIDGTGSGKGSGAITVQLQDAYGNPVDATSAAGLTFNTISGVKYVPSYGSTTACTSTTCAIAAGSSTATFYMTDTGAGSPGIQVTASSITSSVQTETSSAPGTFNGTLTVGTQSGTLAPTGTATYSISVKNTGSSSEYFEVLVDGVPTSATSTLSPTGSTCETITSSSTATWTLSVTNAGSTPAAATSLAVVAERFTTSACSTLTAGSESAATLTISPGSASQLVIMTAPVSGSHTAGRTIGPILVQEQDQYGNPVNVSSSTSVGLTSSSGTGTFASTSGGGAVTSVTISSGSSYQTFYYGDTTAGSPVITASAGSLSWSQTETIS
ncbi:MAG TPA: hypothetical protein VED84_00565 [Acidimicrobiales bacterium]|nr:hypothetical protein [Acidimicrobiales bacterium]